MKHNADRPRILPPMMFMALVLLTFDPVTGAAKMEIVAEWDPMK